MDSTRKLFNDFWTPLMRVVNCTRTGRHSWQPPTDELPECCRWCKTLKAPRVHEVYKVMPAANAAAATVVPANSFKIRWTEHGSH
jgi:hypothetical protein